MNWKKTLLLPCLLTIVSLAGQAPDEAAIRRHAAALQTAGEPPMAYVLNKLDSFPLLLFDDGLHTALEPYTFCGELVRNPAFRQRARYLFLEVISVNQQAHVDTFLRAPEPDMSLLYPAFQNNINGLGWRYRNVLDLLRTVYEVNRGLPAGERLQVIGVASPTYWEAIHTPRDVELYRQTLDTYDYAMYRTILRHLNGLDGPARGIFLANTRHTYAGIRDREGQLYWNCGTFFRQRHPGKTFSVRFHNVTLLIERAAPDTAADGPARSFEGLERYTYRWGRQAGGVWDEALACHGNRAAAIDLAGTPFGAAPYEGNHMANALPGQTMADAYDGIIFLAPLDRLQQTAMTADLYTPAFRRELARRLAVLYPGDRLPAFLREAGAASVDDYVDKVFRDEPAVLSPQAQAVLAETGNH